MGMYLLPRKTLGCHNRHDRAKEGCQRGAVKRVDNEWQLPYEQGNNSFPRSYKLPHSQERDGVTNKSTRDYRRMLRTWCWIGVWEGTQ